MGTLVFCGVVGLDKAGPRTTSMNPELAKHYTTAFWGWGWESVCVGVWVGEVGGGRGIQNKCSFDSDCHGSILL